MKERIVSLEKIILQVEKRIRSIYNETNIEELDKLDTLFFNNTVNLENEIIDHKSAINYNN